MSTLLTCARHGRSPGGVICRHIEDGTATAATPRGRSGPEVLLQLRHALATRSVSVALAGPH
jgi:hypothetical protein